jgi:hypothetical protein
LKFIWDTLLADPIFDSTDFQFIGTDGDQLYGISIERRLLAMVLLAWAASFCIDEHGVTATMQNASTNDMASGAYGRPSESPRVRTDRLVNRILNLVDSHGLLRNPTWDGVRLLLLIWPLTQGTQRTLERVVSWLLHASTRCDADSTYTDNV